MYKTKNDDVRMFVIATNGSKILLKSGSLQAVMDCFYEVLQEYSLDKCLYTSEIQIAHNELQKTGRTNVRGAIFILEGL